MEIIWLIAAILGVIGGIAISHAVFAAPVPLTHVKKMIIVWSALLAAFLLAPLLLIPLGLNFSWRPFGIYRLTTITAIFCFGTCLAIALWHGVKLSFGKGNPRDGS